MNKQLYRVIFSKSSGTCIAVAETIIAQGKQGQRSKASTLTGPTFPLMRLSTLGVFVAALFGHVSVAQAQMVAYKNGVGPRPLIDQSANGRTVVQIVNPNARGLSHNKYDQFNVDANGVILNNSPTNVSTQLGGYIQGNPQLGASANLILNEVLGVNRSILNGYIEVAGQRAEVIVANPNGISVGNGAGFINTTRSVLTTGTPVFGDDGSLAAFRVTKGDITIGSGGLDARGTTQLDLLARSIQINDAIHANQLNVVAGANQIDYANLGVSIIQGEGGQPTVALDSSALGGMYAQKIQFIGTEKGVGVNFAGELAATAGDIRLDHAGKITITGKTNASGQINVRSDDDISHSGTMYGQSGVNITSAKHVSNTGIIATQSHLNLTAASINSTGILGAGIDSDGRATQGGNLTLTASGQIISTGQHSVGGDISMTGADIDLTDAQTDASGDVTLNATAGDVDHSNGVLNAAGNMVVTATGAIINDGGSISVAGWNSTSNTLSNVGGELIQTGTGNSSITANTINNSGTGFIGGNGNLTIESATINNNSGTMYAKGNLSLTDGLGAQQSGSSSMNNSAGQISAGNNLDLAIDTLSGVGTILAGHDATINLLGNYTNVIGNLISANNILNFSVTGNFINQGTFAASQGLNLSAANITNQNGALINSGATKLIAQNSFLNQGRIYGDNIAIGATYLTNGTNAIIASRNSLNLGAASITNEENASLLSAGDMAIGGALDANGQATGKATSVVNNSAIIDAGGNLAITAARLDNLNAHFATETELVSQEFIVDYSFDGVNWYKIGEGATWHDNDDYNLVEIGGRIDKHFYQRSYIKTVTRSKVISSAPGQILANGNITLNVDTVNNYASTIVAGLGLGGTGQELYNNTPQGVTTTTLFGDSSQGRGIRYHDTESCGIAGEDECNRWSGFDSFSTSADVPLDLTIWPNGQPDRLTNPANGQPTGDNDQTVTTPDGQLPNVKLPTNQLFIIVTDPTKNYLIETDPAYTNYATFLSSDYMLSRFSMNPQAAQKRLGDGYYEQQLVANQILQLTGRRFLEGFTNNEAEFQALMNNGLKYAEEFQLTPGIALSAEQMAALTTDMVWMVNQTVTLPDGSTTQVLAPVVYLANVKDSHLTPSGALIAAQNTQLNYGTVNNVGTLQATNQLVVNATDITNSGTVQSRNKDGTGTAMLIAKNDITSSGTINANQAGLQAGRDVNIQSSTTSTTSQSGEHTGISQVATINADQLTIQSGRDTNLNAASVNTTGNATVVAGNNVNIGTVTTSDAIHANWGAEGHLQANSSQTIGSQIKTGGDFTLSAGNDINATASYVNSDKGITAVAGRDINVKSGQQTSSYDNESHFSSSDLLSSQQTDLYDKGQSQQAISSTFSGDKVTLAAGRDLTITGSNAVSTNGTTLAAGNNVTITTAENTSSRYVDRQEQKSGLMAASGGIGITLGDQEKQNTQTNQSLTHTASTVGSTDGHVNIQAGNAYTQTGSNVLALKGDTNVVAKSIDINEVHNTERGTEDNRFEQSGLTLAISAPVIQAVQTIKQMSDATSKTDDARMQVMGAAVAANAAVQGVQAAQNPTQGVTISLTIGSSQSESHSEYTSSSAQGSQINAGGNVNLVATGGGKEGSHINVIGSDINAGQNVALISDGKINLEAAQNSSSQHSTSSSSSAAVGVAATYGSNGFAFGITANASGSRGNADGSDTSHTNTHVNAGKQLIIASGGDTTLKGAVATGQQVIADIQGNLNMESLQDTSKYDSKDENIGGSITVGYGVAGSINAGQTKVNGDYRSVGEQTGIAAGDGGFQVNVKGNTDLKGAVIASTQNAIDQNKNSFTTGTLTQSELQNHSHYDASSWGIGMSMGKQDDNKAQTAQSDAYQVAHFTGGMSGTSAGFSSKDGDSQSTTRSGISGNANGTGITVTDDKQQQTLTGKSAAETVASINKDITTATSSNSLNKDWDAQQLKDQVQAGAQITAAFGQAAAKGIGDYAESKKKELEITDPAEAAKWAEGGEYRVALQTAAGALSGGLQGAAGAFTSATAMNVIGETIEQMGLPKEVAQGLSQVAAGALGGLVGGGAGMASGINVEANNRQLHEDSQAKEKTLAADLAKKAKEQGLLKPDGTPYTAAELENALRSADNTTLGETAQMGMVVPLDENTPAGAIHDTTGMVLSQDGKGNAYLVQDGAMLNIPPEDLRDFIQANTGDTYTWDSNTTSASNQATTGNNAMPNEPRYFACATAECVFYGANRNPNNPVNQAEDARQQEKVYAAGIIIGAPFVVAGAAELGVPAWTAYQAATASYSMGTAFGTGAVVGGATYAGGAAAGAFYDQYKNIQNFGAGFDQRFSYQGLAAAMTVGGLTSMYSTAMFSWAGVPNALSNWTTIPGALIRTNSMAAGGAAGQAAQGAINSSTKP